MKKREQFKEKPGRGLTRNDMWVSNSSNSTQTIMHNSINKSYKLGLLIIETIQNARQLYLPITKPSIGNQNWDRHTSHN